jgi:uncharacterized membrane protein
VAQRVTPEIPATAETVDLVFPSHDDPVVRGASRVVGGPIGDHATLRSGPKVRSEELDRGGPRGRGWWTVLRVLLLFAILTSVAGYASKQPCRDTRNWSKKGYQYTRLCYSDVKALYDSAGLTQGKRPYLDTPLEYPVLLGGAIQGAASIADHEPGSQYIPAHTTADGKQVAASYSLDRRSATFFDVSVLLLALAFCIAVLCTALTAGPRIWDAALLALAPGVVLHLGTNWDMLAVAFASAALLAWSRKRPALAGVLIGLGAATKLYPILLLLPLLVLCVRAGKLRSWVRAAVAAVVTAFLVYLPVYLAAPIFVAGTDGSFTKVPDSSAWHQLTSGQFSGFLHALAPHHGGGLNGTWRFFQLNADRTADWDSIPFVLQHFTHHVFGTGALTAATGAGFLLLFAGITWLGISAPRRPRVGQLAFLTVVAFLLTNKVFSPQYVLWLIPLYVLARPRWWPFLVWQASEFVLLILRYSHFVNLQYPTRGVPESWFVGAVCARDLILILLCALIVRDIWQPERDVIRATTGRDDPAGGVLDEARGRWEGPAPLSNPVTRPAEPVPV